MKLSKSMMMGLEPNEEEKKALTELLEKMDGLGLNEEEEKALTELFEKIQSH